MLRNLKFLTFGLLIVGFVGLSIGKHSSVSCKGSGTPEQFRVWLKGMRSTIAKSGTPVTTDELYEAWQNDRVELVLNEHKIPTGSLPPRPANSEGMCSPARGTLVHSSSRNRKGSSSRNSSSKGSSSSGHSKGSSSSGHSKGSSSSGHSKGSGSSTRRS